jgi:hypothetical protein
MKARPRAATKVARKADLKAAWWVELWAGKKAGTKVVQ